MKNTRERVPKGLSDEAAESGESDIEVISHCKWAKPSFSFSGVGAQSW